MRDGVARNLTGLTHRPESGAAKHEASRPIGGGEIYVTDALIVGGNQQVEVTVARVIQMSSMSVWTQR